MKQREPEKQKSTHGGAGRGQGRKTKDQVVGLRRVNVSLDQDSICTLREIGAGELSLGIRMAAAAVKNGLPEKVIGTDTAGTSFWDGILSDVRGLCADYEGIVVIGGAAVWLQTRKFLGQPFLQTSHDVDLYMGLQDFSILKDIEEVTINPRLGKYQRIGKVVDFDIYVEKSNDLAVPYEDADRFSEVIEGIRCACREHLLVLKLRAFENRQHSAKGHKDAKDIAKILALLSESEDRKPAALDHLRGEDRKRLKEIADTPKLFQDIAQSNVHLAKQLRGMAKRGLDYVETAHEPESSRPNRVTGSSPGYGGGKKPRQGPDIDY